MRYLAVILLVLAVRSAAANSTCKPSKRFVFDPPGRRHSLPQLTFDPKGHVLIGYDGPPIELQLSTIDLGAQKTRSAKLGAGGIAATASDGARIGIVFVANDPAQGAQIATDKRSEKPLPTKTQRYQSYFTVVTRDGKTVIPRIPLGDRSASHSAPGVAIAWNAEHKEWGVLWTEVFRVQFARLDAKGRVLATRELSTTGGVNSHGRLLWTGARYAYVLPAKAGLSLFEFDDKQLRQTTIPAATVLEPVVAYANGVFGIAFRTARELAFVRVKDGKELGRSVVTSLPSVSSRGSNPQIARDAPSAPPTPPRGVEPTLGSISIAADGSQFVLVWAQGRSATFDDRLMTARFDATGAIAAGYPKRLDPEEIHQGYASIAGTGCELAVSYILGDPNHDVRVAVTRAP